MQSKADLEDWYVTKDPWGYETNPHDAFRLETILEELKPYAPFERALDVGAGEGWLTQHLPAKHIDAIELSDRAASRFPKNVHRVSEPHGSYDLIGRYDLIIATGVLYPQYDWQSLIHILKGSTRTILTCNISDWELGLDQLGKPDVSIYFPYRHYTEHLAIFNF